MSNKRKGAMLLALTLACSLSITTMLPVQAAAVNGGIAEPAEATAEEMQPVEMAIPKETAVQQVEEEPATATASEEQQEGETPEEEQPAEEVPEEPQPVKASEEMPFTEEMPEETQPVKASEEMQSAEELPEETQPVGAMLEEGQPENTMEALGASNSYDVTLFGANGNDNASDYSAIQEALSKAKSTNEAITVNIPAGTYYLDDVLQVYSNTSIVLASNATIKRSPGYTGTMLTNSSDDDKKPVGGYGRSKNISVTGGTWDGATSASGSGSNNLYFGHASDITIKNTTIKNAYKLHLVEITGCENVVVNNVVFSGFTKSGTESEDRDKEALQLDVITAGTSELMEPYDKTVCRNVTVSDCTFSNYPCGVGTHSDIPGVYSVGITIERNTFENIEYRLVGAFNFNDLTVKNNIHKITNGTSAYNFIYATGATGTISDNKFLNAREHGMAIVGKSKLTVQNNIFGSSGDNGIYANDSTVTISGNTINGAKNAGIRLVGKSVATVKGNTIAGCANGGISVNQSSGTILENTVDNCKGEISGISLEMPISVKVESNTIKNTTSNGINVVSGNVNTILNNNTINNVGNNAILVFGANGTTISNNKINTFKKQGIYLRAYDSNQGKKSSNVQITGNQVRGGEYGIVVEKAENTTVDNNVAIGSTGADFFIYDTNTGTRVTNNAYGNEMLIYDKSASQSNNVFGTSRNGLLKGSDGKWYYYVNGRIDTGYTGLARNDNGWFYITKGSLDWGYTGLARNSAGWFYVSNGQINWNYTGLAKNNAGWFYVKKGQIDFGFTGLVKKDGAWFYVKNGQLDWNYTGLAKNNGAWFYVKGGVLDWGYTGLARNSAGWFYVSNGQINWNYTGLAKNQAGWFYVKKGQIDFGFTGLVKKDGAWFYVKNGGLDWSYTGLAKNNGEWFYVKGGVLDWGYTGIAGNSAGSFYVKNGQIDFGYTGVITYNGTRYNVVRGKVI